MNNLSLIDQAILNSDLEAFTKVRISGFQPQKVIELVKPWPKTASEFKLHIIADTLLTYYKENPKFGKQLSKILYKTKKAKRDTACYRLGKITSSWLHQRWPSLPSAELSPEKAYNLFPQHALAPPSIPLPENRFETKYFLRKKEVGGKTLKRPLEWNGALDAFSSVLEHIPKPENISVIGFGEGAELLLLNKKWPDTAIQGFERTQMQNNETQIDFPSISSNITVHYENNPDSYRHFDKQVTLILIRHPDTIGISWSEVLFKALDALSSDGSLLITFYSEKEMLALKEDFLQHEESTNFFWSEVVNPFAYNPFFVSKTGAYSFDLFLVTIQPKNENQNNFLNLLPISTKRTYEERPFPIASTQKKFIVVEHDHSSIVTLPDHYEKAHKDPIYGAPQSCLKCSKSSGNYFRVFNRIDGKSPIIGHSLFCNEHIPPAKADWETMLHEPWSSLKNASPGVLQFKLIAQSIPKN